MVCAISGYTTHVTYLSFAFPVSSRTCSHADFNHPGFYPGTALRNGYRPVRQPRTVPLVIIPFPILFFIPGELSCSPCLGYALWECDRRHLSVSGSYPERARVSYFLITPISKLSAHQLYALLH